MRTRLEKKLFGKTRRQRVISVFCNRRGIQDLAEFSILIRIDYVETSTIIILTFHPLVTMAGKKTSKTAAHGAPSPDDDPTADGALISAADVAKKSTKLILHLVNERKKV